MWDKEQPVILTQATVNNGKGVITAMNHGGCDWNAFPVRLSVLRSLTDQFYWNPHIDSKS